MSTFAKRTASTKYPPLSDGDLDAIRSAGEMDAAFYYEFAREIPEVRERMRKWRRNEPLLRRNAIKRVLQSIKPSGKYSLADEVWLFSTQNPWGGETTVSPPEFLACFDAFPEQSWIHARKSRKAAVVDHWKDALRGARPTWNETWTDLSGLFPPEADSPPSAPFVIETLWERAQQGHTTLVLSFDRSRYNDRELIGEFKQWLKNRPRGPGERQKRNITRRHFSGESLPFTTASALKWLNLLRSFERSANDRKVEISERVAIKRANRGLRGDGKFDETEFARVSVTVAKAHRGAREVLRWFKDACPATDLDLR